MPISCQPQSKHLLSLLRLLQLRPKLLQSCHFQLLTLSELIKFYRRVDPVQLFLLILEVFQTFLTVVYWFTALVDIHLTVNELLWHVNCLAIHLVQLRARHLMLGFCGKHRRRGGLAWFLGILVHDAIDILLAGSLIIKLIHLLKYKYQPYQTINLYNMYWIVVNLT